MNPSNDVLEASYAFCRQASRRAGSSFRAGFWLLPREKRRAMEALYAFMRHTDDLADDVNSSLPLREGAGARSSGQWSVVSGQRETAVSNLQSPIANPGVSSPHPNPLPKGEGTIDVLLPKGEGIIDVLLPRGEGTITQLDVRRESLVAWRAALEQALQSEVSAPPSPCLPFSAFPLSPLLPALADTVRRFHIPHEHLSAVIDGVEMDLTTHRYETFDELERYCERVASAVGLACIHIWGFRGAEAFEPARQAGVALQLTNILRDLKEDAAAARVYLPLADLRRCGYSLDDLKTGVANEAFYRLMQFEIERAKRFYRGGAELWNWLEPDGRRIFGLMTATYWRLMKQIEQCPAEVLRRRVRLSPLTKIRLFASWMLLSQKRSKILKEH